MGYEKRTIDFNGLELDVTFEYEEGQKQTLEQEPIPEGFVCFESITCRGLDMLFLEEFYEDDLIELIYPDKY